jgi:hypothetical protein
MKRNEQSLKKMWATIKHTSMYIIRPPQRKEEAKKGERKIFEEITAENFPDLLITSSL